jgi:hypothetical protein
VRADAYVDRAREQAGRNGVAIPHQALRGEPELVPDAGKGLTFSEPISKPPA